jgi:hypothetical protein
MGKGGRKVKMVQKCVHMYVNGKVIHVETTPAIWEGREKEEQWRGESKYDIFDTL